MFNMITKIAPTGVPAQGQYYMNVVNMTNDWEFPHWKFSLSGPGNNGPTVARYLLGVDELEKSGLSIQKVVSVLYTDLLARYADIVVRATY